MLLFLAASIAFAWRHTPIDDAFITYRYAKNLAAGHGAVFNVGERVEGYTSLAWMSILALGEALGLASPLVSKVLGLALGAGTLGLVAAAPFDARTRLAGGALLALHAPFLYHALNGLETALMTCLVTALAVWSLEPGGPRRAVPAVAALLVLTRPEGLPCVLVWHACATATRSVPFRRLLPVSVEAGAVFAAHSGIRWLYYGDWVANSARAKMLPLATALPAGLADWHAYLRDAGAWGLVAVLAAAGAWLDRGHRATRCLALFVFGFGLVLAVSGGDAFPLWRFYVPLAPLLLLVAARGLVVLALGPRGAAQGPRRSVALGAAFAALALATALPLATERAGVEREGQWARHWEAVGRRLALLLPPDTSIALCPVGALSYTSDFRRRGSARRAGPERELPSRTSGARRRDRTHRLLDRARRLPAERHGRRLVDAPSRRLHPRGARGPPDPALGGGAAARSALRLPRLARRARLRDRRRRLRSRRSTGRSDRGRALALRGPALARAAARCILAARRDGGRPRALHGAAAHDLPGRGLRLPVLRPRAGPHGEGAAGRAPRSRRLARAARRAVGEHARVVPVAARPDPARGGGRLARWLARRRLPPRSLAAELGLAPGRRARRGVGDRRARDAREPVRRGASRERRRPGDIAGVARRDPGMAAPLRRRVRAAGEIPRAGRPRESGARARLPPALVRLVCARPRVDRARALGPPQPAGARDRSRVRAGGLRARPRARAPRAHGARSRARGVPRRGERRGAGAGEPRGAAAQPEPLGGGHARRAGVHPGPRRGNVLNNWSLGGLLLYFGHPSVRVSIDSRADPYPFSYFQRHQRALVGPPGELRAFVAAYAIDAIVLGRPIYDGIRHNLSVLPGFRTAFVDDRTAVLLREAGGGRR